MTFGKRLRETRIQKKLTQQALADIIDVPLRSYQRYEQGTRQPSFDILIAIADALDVTTDRLLCRDEKE